MSTLNQQYRGLFDSDAIEDEEEVRRGQGGLSKQYGWLVALDNLSQSRPETWPYYYEMGVIEFLNLLSYYKAKQRQINAQREFDKLRRGRSIR